jgi:hypothetical protein
MKDRECLWKIVSVYGTQNWNVRENSVQKIVQQVDFPEPTVPEVKLKIKTVRAWCAAELLQVKTPDWSDAGLRHIYVPK